MSNNQFGDEASTTRQKITSVTTTSQKFSIYGNNEIMLYLTL